MLKMPYSAAPLGMYKKVRCLDTVEDLDLCYPENVGQLKTFLK